MDISNIKVNEMDININNIKVNLVVRLISFTFNIERLTRTLKNRGFNIEIITAGRTVEIPITALQDRYSLYINPVESTFTISSTTLEETMQGYKQVSQILTRDFKVTQTAIIGFTLDYEVSVKTQKNAREVIEKRLSEIPYKFGLAEYFGKETRADSVRIVIPSEKTPDSICIISPWSQSPDCYYMRLVLNYDSKSLEKIKSMELEKIATIVVRKIEVED